MKHTSVIYVHGVGNPQRHVSLSQLLDHLDFYGEYQARAELGKARSFQTCLERLSEDVIHYSEFHKVVYTGAKPKSTKKVRVYEAYWAPEAQAKFSITDILSWMFQRLVTPMRILFSSWRSYSAFRINELHRLAIEYDHPGRIEKLETFYREFQHKGARAKYSKGTFSQYRQFLNDHSHQRDKAHLSEAALRWKRFITIRSLTTWCFLILGVSSFVWILMLAAYCLKLSMTSLLFSDDWQIAFLVRYTLVGLLGIVLGLKTFFSVRKYLFDVMAWTLSSEKDRRYRSRLNIVEFTQKLLKHVVSNDNCRDCIIIGHSLGTAISLEALFKEGELARLDKDADYIDNLCKIRTVYSIGSPIDLIFNMFQSNRVFSHRFNRISEDTRLSVGLPPFHLGKGPGQTEFVNFWCRFDPISSVVSSIRKKYSERTDAIINVETLPPKFPLPVQTHITYFSDPAVTGAIYNDIMGGSRALLSRPRDNVIPRWFRPLLNIFFSLVLLLILTWAALADRWLLPSVASALVGALWGNMRFRVAGEYQAEVGRYLRV